jgi:hypothetical protein
MSGQIDEWQNKSDRYGRGKGKSVGSVFKASLLPDGGRRANCLESYRSTFSWASNEIAACQSE